MSNDLEKTEAGEPPASAEGAQQSQSSVDFVTGIKRTNGTRAELKHLAFMDKVQLIIAMSAIMISMASFYATYLQAESEEHQVKAATWPFLQVSSGNYNADKEKKVLSFALSNVGVGPAYIQNFKLSYNGKTYPAQRLGDLLDDCCSSEEDAGIRRPLNLLTGPLTSGSASSQAIFLPAGDDISLLTLPYSDDHEKFWEKLNTERWNIKPMACYCSLLDQCFVTNFQHDPIEVDSCEARDRVLTQKLLAP